MSIFITPMSSRQFANLLWRNPFSHEERLMSAQRESDYDKVR